MKVETIMLVLVLLPIAACDGSLNFGRAYESCKELARTSADFGYKCASSGRSSEECETMFNQGLLSED